MLENIFFMRRIDVYMKDIALPPISVFVLTFLATENEYSKSLFNLLSIVLFSSAILYDFFTCPNTSLSPTTIESNPETTLNKCLIASSS